MLAATGSEFRRGSGFGAGPLNFMTRCCRLIYKQRQNLHVHYPAVLGLIEVFFWGNKLWAVMALVDGTLNVPLIIVRLLQFDRKYSREWVSSYSYCILPLDAL
jgi:hypothetical protein